MSLREKKFRSDPLKLPENTGIAMRPLGACNDKKGVVGQPLKGIIGMVDTRTKFASMEGQIKKIEHIFLEHLGLEKKAQAV